MSSALLIVAMAGIFGAVLMGILAVGQGEGQRKRVLEHLESAIRPAYAGVAQAAGGSFVDRAILPLAGRFADAARRFAPADMRARLTKKLVLAGAPEGWDAERLAVVKFAGLICGPLLGLLIATGSGGGLFPILLIVVLGFIGFFGPDAVLDRIAQARQDQVRKALPDTIDLLTISVEAGLGFDAAMAHVVQKVPGPLSEEIARMLQEMQLGIKRSDALKQLSTRSDVDELRAFVLSLVQADRFGVSVGNVLRSQARELRAKRKAKAERKAMQTPVKILFPLILCVLPALFVVVIGPGALRIIDGVLPGLGGP